MWLTFRFVVRLENALRRVLIVRLETRLNPSDFALQIVDTPRTTDQTECLFHRFTHGCECEASAHFALASSGQAVSEQKQFSERAAN